MAQTFMASDQEASSSNSSNSNSVRRTWKYDIFLSFRGEDTRKSFTDHLYHALKKTGFRVFRDNEDLKRGEVITEELKRAIEDSHFAIVVLSKNYALSSWCLNELQHILYSRNTLCQQVSPIFYDVDPSHVYHQRGSFADAFATHQMLQRDYMITEGWRACLTKVAALSGWNCKDRHEAELIDKVVKEMHTKLRDKIPHCREEQIGIDDKVIQSTNYSYSNSAQRTWKYDIFLSFRSEDTRKSFTDHLYHALKKSGFRVFRDIEGLERGEVITEGLKRAIEDSLFAIVVLSKNYASSSWCLNELQHILYSRDNLYQQVFPIFYDVDPSHVRRQRGSFVDTFAAHQMLQRDNKITESWRDSLTKVANLSGWDCKDQHEAELIDNVVEEMWTILHDKLPPCSEKLIGINDKVKQLEPLLEIGVNDVRFVGIWGLAGVGKTTIARTCFEKYRSQFDTSCFLYNIRATSRRDGEVHLQSRLLSHLKIRGMEIEDPYEGKQIIQNRFCNKKVLLVLDDVSHTSQLENLANSPNWFGAGSRVIITTRYLDLLRRVHKVYVHEVRIMDRDESLQLFCQKAFGRGKAPDNLLEMSQTVCDYAKRIPLALSVLGSFFWGKTSVTDWKDALDMLKKDPREEIFETLEIGFKALSKTKETRF